MIRFLTFLLFVAVLCGLTASTALAAIPCTSYAGMADQDRDGFCAFVSAATATTSGWKGKIDCDDTDKAVHPGASEVLDDGIDQDCNGRDMILPVREPAYRRYVANEYGGKAPKPETFALEYSRCFAATGRCSTDSVHGIFVITDPETDILCDVHIGGSLVEGSDGVREIVTLEVASHRFPGVKAGDSRCEASNGSTKESASSSGSSSATPKPSGISRATATKIADASAAKATDALRKDMQSADTALGGRVDTLESVDEVITSVVNNHTNKIVDLEAETARAKKATEDAVRIVKDALDAAAEAKFHGPLFEAGVVGGGLVHRALNTSEGDPVRGVGVGGVGFEVRAGVDASRVQFAGFGQFSFGSDGLGTGPDNGLLVGADLLFDAGPVELGPWVGFVRAEDHANLLDVSVVESGGLVGVTLQGNLAGDSAFRAVPFFRAGIGAGFYGTKGVSGGDVVVVSDYGGLALVQVGCLIGAGALER